MLDVGYSAADLLPPDRPDAPALRCPECGTELEPDDFVMFDGRSPIGCEYCLTYIRADDAQANFLLEDAR